MKKKNIKIISFLAIILVIGIGSFFILGRRILSGHAGKQSESAAKDIYFCPMHPNFTSDKPGSCSICGMNLVKKQIQAPPDLKKSKKILYYRNPMDPTVTSPVPMKDSMGMDYVPVYGEEAPAAEAGIYISPEKQQLIGLKKETVEKRKLLRQILTVGRIAYDPELYVAQEEYLQALKTLNATKSSVLVSIIDQSNSLLIAAEKKLLLLGMSKNQIQELAGQGKSQQNLYLPGSEETVWVYMTIYEYEIGLIKEGQAVEIDAIAFPGEVFTGKIVAITPVLDPMTRSIQVRAEIKNLDHKLKPEMYVNAKIQVDLGEKTAVPESAVLDTGLRKIVYVVKEGDMLEFRDVTLGQKAQGYFEVLDGLKEGDIVVTSGNFLVDSESKLKGVTAGSTEHKHGQ